MFNKKASLEVSVGMIVSIIIGVLVLGLGIILFNRASNSFENEYEKIGALHEAELRKALASGKQVSVYPQTITINRGDDHIFTLSISNNLGANAGFSVFIMPSPSQAGFSKITYDRTGTIQVKNNEVGFMPFKIETAKDQGKMTYLFNVCVYPTSAVPSIVDYSCTNTFGSVEKITINAR
jgi:hypothetical protein